MQSYAQILDPGQTIGDLRSLGARLELPRGWAFRTRRLKRDLTLRANGEATIVQDDLQNTYQRLPRARRERHRVAVTGATKSVGSPAPGTIHDAGTISGDPFGPGTVDILVTFGPDSSASGSFEIDAARGSAFGTVAMTYAITGYGDNVHRDGDVQRRHREVPRHQGDRRRIRPQHPGRPERVREARGLRPLLR